MGGLLWLIRSSFGAFGSVEAFDPVIVDEDDDGQVDFSQEGLENSRSTVSLALSGDPDSGTSSFFVNIGENQGLDGQGFVPFAVVEDMSTVDYIMRLGQVSDPSAGLASSSIPVVDESNMLVYVERAFVLDPDPVATMTAAATMASEPIEEPGSGGSSSPVVASIPEPPALVLVVAALVAWTVVKGPRR